MIGKTLAHYEVLELLGKGGMGEVYRARDTRLGRDVAIKLIAPELAFDSERIARFRREARALASLSHPHIAQIFGIEEAGGIHFIAMELVEGEDLLHRLLRGALSVEDALETGEAIALALEAAHEQGIIHRDLKPANVKLGADGQVKLLDFGLARAALDGDDADPSNSPTVTAAFTQAGTILGTAAYMSPEQARGRVADQRADIWSFGVLLYEMFTGKRLFEGDTVSDTLAMVIRDQPNFDALPENTPAIVRTLIARCLEKDRKQRLQSIGEARIAIQRARSGGDDSSLLGAASAASVTVATTRPLLPWILTLLFVAAAGVFVGTRLRSTETATDAHMFDLEPPALEIEYPRNVRLSPDGRRIAYYAGGVLHVRDLRQLDPVTIPNTDTATAIFWSPDGEWLGFGRTGQIFRVAAGGGTPEVICNVNFIILDGASWGEDGSIILAPDAGPLQIVSERGGDPVELFQQEGSESDYHTPSHLPNGRGILFTTHNAAGRETIEVLANGTRKVLLNIPGARLEYATYSAGTGSSNQGVIIYHRLQSNPGIYAVPFDLDRLELTGEPALLDAKGAFPSLGGPASMVYARDANNRNLQFVVVDTEGRILRRIGEAINDQVRFALSPDRRQILSEGGGDIWLHDIERGSRNRVTFDTTAESTPSWFHDGRHFVYSAAPGGASQISYMSPVDGSAEPTLIARGSYVSAVGASEEFVFTRFQRGTMLDIYRGGPDLPDSGVAFVQSPRSDQSPALSPDGRFLAYMSDVDGRNQVYLRRFPEGDGQWQVSLDGGVWPRWAMDGSFILYRQRASGLAQMVRVRIQTDPEVLIGAPEPLFDARSAPNLSYASGYPAYDTMENPDELLMLEQVSTGEERATKIIFVENWRRSFAYDEQAQR